MFCTNCRCPLDSGFNFCPTCGSRIHKDVATAAPQPPAAEGKVDQAQAPKDVQEKQENTDEIKLQGLSAGDDSQPASDGATPKDPSDKAVSPATVETAPTSPPLKAQLDGELTAIQQVKETCKEEQRLSLSAAGSNCEPCRQAIPESNLSVPTKPPSPAPYSDKVTEQHTKHPADSREEGSADVLQGPADKPGDLSEQTPQQAKAAKQPVHEQEKDKTISNETHNLSRKPGDNETGTDTEQHQQTDRKEDKAAGAQDSKKKNKNKSANRRQETGGSAKSTEVTSNVKTQKLSGKPVDNKTGTGAEQHTAHKKSDRKEVKAAIAQDDQNTKNKNESADQRQKTRESAKSTEVVGTTSSEKPSTDSVKAPKQQQGNRNEDISKPHTPTSPGPPSHGAVGHPGAANRSQLQIDCISVYFHAVTSNDPPLDPEKHEIFLVSEKLFGSWEILGQQMSFSRHLGDKRYLVEGHVLVHKDAIKTSIPYKYCIFKRSENGWKSAFEIIFLKEENVYVNRCLSIQQDLLTYDGSWHQYDDMIHSELKKGWMGLKFWASLSQVVIKGREFAGEEMLKMIFGLLTTWNEQNVENFFLLLQQFYFQYRCPMLHDGSMRHWGIQYGTDEVNALLKYFLDNNILNTMGKEKPLLPPLHAGVIGLLIYNKYLKDSKTFISSDHLSNLCDLLCLPNEPQNNFIPIWKEFSNSVKNKNGVADVVEMLCNTARQRTIKKWVLLIPLIHLLREESKPFEPVPCVLSPQFDSWSGLKGSKGTHIHLGSYTMIMKDHSYLVDIDHLLVHSWMSLVDMDDLLSFISNVLHIQVELLDILHYLQFNIRSEINYSVLKSLEKVASHLVQSETHRSKSFDDRYGECCLKTAVRVLASVCSHTKDPNLCELPLQFLDLVCLIAKTYGHTDSKARERCHEDSVKEMLEIMRKWRRNTFTNKLLSAWNKKSYDPNEIKVWTKLLSVSFSHEEHLLSYWRNTFMKDFEGRLKKEKTEDQIGLYCNTMEELSKTSPLLCSTMENCAMEVIARICQDKSGTAVSGLLRKHDITKFGKLMSVVVLKSWPTDSKGDYIQGEDLIFQNLVNWPMAKMIFQMAGAGEELADKLSEEAQIRVALATSAFKSVSMKFLSGEIQVKTLEQILTKEREFVGLLKLDILCDDGRCKDDRNMEKLLVQRRKELKDIQTEKERVRGLLQVCQELPEHIKVDFKDLDTKLNQNIETMNLNALMEVHTLDEQTSSTTGKITYFNLCDITRQMASELHAIKDSLIFKMCWTNRVEELSREQDDEDDTEPTDGNEEVYTLELVHSKIFQSCYSKYKELYDSLKSGELLLEEIDSIFNIYKGKYKDLEKDLNTMCRVNRSDDRKWVKKRIEQIEQYQDLHLAMETSKIIMEIKNMVCSGGDFSALGKLLQMDEANFRTYNLSYIDDDFIRAKDSLKDITDDRKKCLQELSQREEFVLWVKKELEDISELKVFVDLASISAGENDLDVDRVACFHDAVLGYSSILYGLQQDSGFEDFKDSLSKLWKALDNDRNIPEKLRDTARHLEWLKTVRESHGSVELSSLSLATSINERGIYTIKAQNQKRLDLDTSVTLQIRDEHEETMTSTYDDLKELQNKLMLMSGRGQQNQSEVEHFTEVFDNVQRLARACVDLHAAGNPLFRCWEAKVYCKPQSDPCIIMDINFCNTLHCIKVTGSVVEQLTLLSKKMELFLIDWQSFMDEQRSVHYYLNYFTAEQIFYLCSVVTPTNVNEEVEDKALMMLSFIKPNCTTTDVWSALRRLQNEYKSGKMDNEDSETSFANVSRFMSFYDSADEAGQTVRLKELEELWDGYMKNGGVFFHDLLDIRSLGGLLKMLTATENQNQNEWEEVVLSETKDKSLRRSLPKGLSSKQPNLIICPHNEILTSSICLYMTSDYEPLPSYDEVLLCTPTTSLEQVELFLRRCLTPGDIGQKIYTMLWADQLTYDVSCAMEKCFRKLHSLYKNDYRLVIFCSSEKEHTYIPTAFSQYKKDIVPQESLESIQKYLSRHYSLNSDHKNAVYKGGHYVGIVASRRAGVGKSLYVQRLYEKLEKSVEQDTAFKKCIPLTEHEIDDHKVLQSLYDTPKQQDLKVFHFDVTSSVRKGLNEFLYKLFFLRYLMDSDGQMWHCSHKHLYVIELLESTNDQPRYAPRSGQKENFAFWDVFPKVFCRPPKEVMALEVERERDASMESDDPLMDDKCFRSEAYQRPYQYLTRFHNNETLQSFTYDGVEGTHAKCLQILLIYCGIIDPSWAELHNFVWFLNLQLKDCESSVFCQFELVGDILNGFKNFVVEFMILMSKDFATPSLCITDQSPGRQQIDISGLNEKDLAPFLIRKRWESEPHPYIFFNDDHTSMTFIGFHLKLNDQKGVDAINPLTGEVIKRNIMTQELYQGLKLQKVPFNIDFDHLPRADKIEHLCSVLGITWPTDPDETYELTTDNMLKMMAIHMRFRCGIPVIIMGETGCGKTRLIKFMSELRRCGAQAENMKLVKVHGGTTSEMIYEKVKEAETLAKGNKEDYSFDSVLFFDEANTTEAISSIKEIICDKSVQGQQLDSKSGLQIIAACNPYRKHTDKMIDRLEASGLGYRVRAQETEDRLGSIPLRQLVYRVHVLPPSMIPLIWDFGQLSDSSEQMYIKQIVQRQAKAISIEGHCIQTITQVLSASQTFMRERKDECSFVSLRDVERCMQVFVWFYKNHPMFEKDLKAFLQQQSKKKGRLPYLPASDRAIWSLLMATGVCYQACLENKGRYQETIKQFLPREYKPQRILQEIELMQDLLLNSVPMGKTIARNEALKENFFMMVVCIELRIPLFIVGKPGSSKSLSKTLVADAMQGPTSHSELYKRLKQIHLVSFQCSPHSTPDGIINTFRQCARFQESKNLDEYISVVVLDEIGLAEDSPKMPLKVLHPLLEEGCVDDEPQPHKRVGFIGISNWALDPAKMNRGIFVSRGDLNEQELIKSAKGICSSEENVREKIKHLFEPFAKGYMTVCKEGKGFFGLRDFYSLIKMVFSVTKRSNERPTADEITGAVLRNFSGKDDVDVIDIFTRALTDDFANASITTLDMVEQSVAPASQVEESRYLLILTKNYAALPILQQIFLSHQIHPEIIFGSSFPKDQEYTQICRNINRVKVCMETGQTVVLLNLQNLYESLYDALNQYYVTLGGQKYVDLGLGTHRVKCRVHQSFRLIVIEEKEVVYEQFPIPLINRLEKHYLDINTVLRNDQKDIARQLQEWVEDFVSFSSQLPPRKQYVPRDVFIGYHSDTCSSVVLQVTETLGVETDAQDTLNKAKAILLNCATPDSVVRLDKSRLPDEERERLIKDYVKEDMHSSLGDYIVYPTQHLEQSHAFFTEVTTFSRLLTSADTHQLQSVIKIDAIKLLSLQQFDTEYSFLKKIREFLGSTCAHKVLIIQTEYDEDFHRGNILSSAKYSCINEINKCDATDGTKIFVYFVTKLPRMEGGTSYVGFQGGPWRSVHIDDLRRSKEFVSGVNSLKDERMSKLFEDPPEAMEIEDNSGVPQNDNSSVLGEVFDTTDLVRSCVQSAVSMLRDSSDNGELSTKRVENLLTLLDGNQQQGVFGDILRKRLHSLLEDYEASAASPDSWVLSEASNFSALQEGGTFLHTLWRKIQTVITPLLAYLVSVIDRDCNLDLLLNSGDDIMNLWLEIFGSKKMLDVPYVRMESNSGVLMIQSHMIGGTSMHCRMPFSWWIKDFLDGLMMQTFRHKSPSLSHFDELFLNTPLGSYMAKNVNERIRKDFFERYLRDFVFMTFMASDEESELLFHALASCVEEVQKERGREEEGFSLPHIHVAYHVFQSRLQNLSRMISLQPQVVPPLRRNQQSRHCPEMILDVLAAKACVECLESPNLETDTLCQDWLRQVKRLQASLELICSHQFTQQYGERSKERVTDVSNGWMRIYFLSLFVEHMLLGFQNEDMQLRTLVLKHSKTLNRVLEGNSVKSTKVFEAVVDVLKSCKQGAVDLIFRHGLQCAVCTRESQDPVGLPCGHIYCSKCIKLSIDAGHLFCPYCKQVLPDNFQPQVSDELRVCIKKNADFRRRNNGFFIDLLSTVWFKDNTLPIQGVITKLLSFLMIETDLSALDESPDKNPVVRSVILKLLLKFRFDEVKEFLQQHLSSVENSPIVDEADKAELYALYINCLEDSLWEKTPQEGNGTQELQFFNEGTAFLQGFLAETTSAPGTVTIQLLQHIAQLRLTLTMAAQLISGKLSGNSVPDGAVEFLNMVIKLCKDGGNDWYRVYLIRKLSEWQGVALIQTLVKQPDFNWLFPEEIHQQNEDRGQVDHYLVYGEEYKEVRGAVAKAVADGVHHVEKIEEVCEGCTASPRTRTVFVLLALFRDVTTLYRSEKKELHPKSELCAAFEDLIQGSNYLHQKEIRKFASALVKNDLGAPVPAHGTIESTVIELIIHLKAVLLSGNHCLLRPLKHLALTPEKMQGAFIPTMPDDILAVTQAVLQQDHGQLTWYVCPNNHPFLVDECGLPTERGQCPECGEDVGGEHHVAFPGSRQVKLKDHTRPGHILGDPERRDNSEALDTKNMSLTPFTLVRLITHLTMLLGASENPQLVQQIIQPRVEDVRAFLTQHITKDLDQLKRALGKGNDDTVTVVHLVLKSLQELRPDSHSGIDPLLKTKASRNTWETAVATDIITPKLKDLDRLLQEAKRNIRTDPRVSSNLIMRTTFGDDCTFLASLQQGSQVHSSAVWSCRERLSLLSLTHIVEHKDQKEELPLLWRFLQKEREFRQIKFLPEILRLQKNLVRKYQNASEQIAGSIAQFIEKQTERRAWYEKHIDTFLRTWNLLRLSVTSNELKIPEEFCSEDLNLNSDFQYLLPRRQGPGLCATGLVSYLVALHNELVNAVDRHTGEDSSGYRVSVVELMEQHVIQYDVEKDLLPLVLSNCQYSLERGHETISQYDLPRIQQQLLTRILQGKPLITRTGIPTLVNTQERDYESIFKTVKGKVPQAVLTSLTRNAVSRELDSYSQVCEALKILELLLGFLSMTGGDPLMPLVSYLEDVLKMAQNIDPQILQALRRCSLKHCVSLWQLLSSLKSENMLRLKMDPFSEYPAEYQKPLTEDDKADLKGFMSKRNVDQWQLEVHEFLLLSLGRPRATDLYKPNFSLKTAVANHMDRKHAEVPRYVEESFPENLKLSQIVEMWKYAVIAKQEWLMEG
ncbi:E3 ubiquitin-protein ligase rnf213-alpha isoform X2 [Mugil cephalus]|uniref:E3 ubiquitin-protein ligase rnf213-alpha isoform X2 n=1 Tax=Mugil cephalus TaxID=48193 RepID=UPI001FB5FF53|nr:E3 ubiquitin-protein ligase rnf213-alpha isoform X2 [Mugil cephalus]